MTRAAALTHYQAVFTHWLAVGGMDATEAGDPWAETLLHVLIDLDLLVAKVDVGWPLPEWAR